ncbi:M16 family metallopeptidase [Erythrobacter rubeus]|uniref:Insulinase family protein n=1 Tax=Erythrobacter rubeus TaxID=2760803 RepID=A0ABR8KR15_9SPHN|nr:M16 family metallopeptidase [Erythrobacter rubeus]MBD2842354.1 insulinase family protein [Erythrobacter rubeus]
MRLPARAIAAGLTFALPGFALTSGLDAQEPVPATEQSPDQDKATWAFETSDVAVDPGYVFGELDNGLRYILRQNSTPEGTALVRMRIDSGSLDETETERGLSHYLEHMAFNGSTGIPEGEMIKLLEREGLAFGADTNASTGFEAITYMLNLPRNDEDLLDTALMLMRETASELTIAPDAVERERGVVLSERRDRAGFRQRAQEDGFEFLAPDARFADRLPIGTIESLETASAEQLRALYERTYTPANTVLVIVGDFPTELMERTIRAKFADWQAAPAPVDPETGPLDITRKGLTDIYIDPALPESVAFSRLSPWRDRPDTVAERRASVIRSLGYRIVNRRLSRLSRGEDAPFRAARFGSNDIFEDARATTLTVSSADGEWRKGVLAAVREVHQAMTFGFTQAEIDEQLASFRTALENAVEGEATRTNQAYAGAALSLVSNDRIPTTPAYRLALLEEVEDELTPDNVLASLKDDAAPLLEPLIRFQGRQAPEGGEDALRTALADGLALPIAAPEDTGALEFAYTDFGDPGVVVSDTTEERLGFRYIKFANGVRLTLKKTDIREDRISFRISVDGGNLLNTAEEPLKTAMVSALAAGGLGQHSQDELRTILAGRTVGFGLASNAESFVIGSNTTPRDLGLQLQVAAATLIDPGYRREGVEIYRRGIENYFANLDATPSSALSTQIGSILADGDPRFSLQPKESFLALDYARLEAAIGDRLRRGAIEIALVGDLDEEAAIAAVAATLGALPPREADFLPRNEARIRSFTEDRSPRVLTHSGESDQAILRFYWPTTDDDDFEETLRIWLLSEAVRLEMLDRLREELGQAYSPYATTLSSRVYDDYGTFSLGASIDVDQIGATREAITKMLIDIRDGDAIDGDLLERARKPLLETYDNALKSLGGWMGLADNAQSQPDRLERFFDGPELLMKITPADLKTVANQYLDPETALEVIVVPGEEARAASD